MEAKIIVGHAQMVVIGLRKRSAVSKLTPGSVAQRVLLQAECPILAVRALLNLYPKSHCALGCVCVEAVKF